MSEYSLFKEITDKIIRSNLKIRSNFNSLLNELMRELMLINKNNIIENSNFESKVINNYNKISVLYPDMSYDEYKNSVVKNIANNDPNTILLYMKNPVRQNPFEFLQIYLLENHFNIKIDRYNKSKFLGTKTFDGICDSTNQIFNCKYIKESGDSQDNQFNDLIKFNVKQNKYMNYLIISGDYGIKKMNKWISENKLETNTYVVIMSDDIKIIPDEARNMNKDVMNKDVMMKTFNKYYSTNEELIYDMKLTDEILKVCFNNATIIEPFAGDCDLIKLLLNDIENFESNVRLYDITKIKRIEQLPESSHINFEYEESYDSLLNPVFDSFDKSFVITNPPYTAKNKLSPDVKSKYRELMNDSSIQDLYQIFIKQLIKYNSKISGGLIIVPSNFILGKQSKSIYNEFTRYYIIYKLNIFEKQMFEHTTQSVVSILFVNEKLSTNIDISKRKKIYLHEESSNDALNIIDISNKFDCIQNFDLDYRYQTKNEHNIKVCRNYNIDKNIFKPSRIKVSLIDPDISAHIDEDVNTQDKNTDRAYLRLCFNKSLMINEESLCEMFNDEIMYLRDSTNSLIFTSYRESSRKRLTFSEVYTIMTYIINCAYDELVCE